ncbi:Holliday junction resolvase RecU [Fructilactobacillus sp. Tb1]|uniref:Holliday junction resolvase RecU n=1 Tax=Fructilactobacillus sp. Tb1 TaxID=3422304 RepID=UPI003D2CBA06
MAIKYPNGSKYLSSINSSNKLNSVNYGDRGMTLEQEINDSNAYYLMKEMAVIHKKPTPIQIVKVDYPKRSAAVIREAYFKQASTTDYNGVFNGHYIDFDAKETMNTTAFPLSNFHNHQIEHMQQCVNQGGICFALIKFVKSNEIFILNSTDLFRFWNRMLNGGRKSIAKQEFNELAYKIDYRINPVLPYLDAVQKIIDLSN